MRAITVAGMKDIDATTEPVLTGTENKLASGMRALLFGLSSVALAMAGSVTAHEITQKTLRIVHPWVHETEGQQAALHVKIRNTGEAGERLVRATSLLASK